MPEDEAASAGDGAGVRVGYRQAKGVMIEGEEGLAAGCDDVDGPLGDAVMAGRHKLDAVAIRIGQLGWCGEAVAGDDEAEVATPGAGRQRVAGMVQLEDAALMVVAVLAQAAAERQHMVEGQADILLPEGEHLIETVGEHADIEAILGEPGGG